MFSVADPGPKSHFVAGLMVKFEILDQSDQKSRLYLPGQIVRSNIVKDYCG